LGTLAGRISSMAGDLAISIYSNAQRGDEDAGNRCSMFYDGVPPPDREAFTKKPKKIRLW
jgi:hypothetical protein